VKSEDRGKAVRLLFGDLFKVANPFGTILIASVLWVDHFVRFFHGTTGDGNGLLIFSFQVHLQAK
jgi:hypothetical protein